MFRSRPLVFSPSLKQMSSVLSPAYIEASTKPSSSSSDAPRKLLVLDLNGSLLLRTKRVKKHAKDGPTLRTVHPRPYMQSFREYVFHARVKEWLDTLVWSSAQPHSVKDMVDRCFGGKKADFKAIWARDTFGLGTDQYHQKSQTTKDLEKIWNAFPSHSAYTTCLVDDSPRKARLQPWNHLCIEEYDARLRTRDLEIWQRLHSTAGESKNAKKKEEKKEKRRRQRNGAEVNSSLDTHESQPAALLTPSHEKIADADPDSAGYDMTLLAIIGILDEIKSQTNIAAWIRAGGLSRVKSMPQTSPRLPRPVLDTQDSNTLCEDQNEKEVKDSDEIEENKVAKLLETHDKWFEHPDIVDAWAQKGKVALGELGIDVVPGVH